MRTGTKPRHQLTSITATGILLCALITGCRSAEDRALEQAKAQAASTNTAQQIQYIDRYGDTVTTVIQPPAPGQPQQVTTTTAPPPPGPPPHRTHPVITPLGSGGPLVAQQSVVSSPSAVNESQTSAQALANTASAQPAATYAPSQPAPANQPTAAVNFAIPAGTSLAVRVNQRIDVKHAHAGERFSGEIVEPVTENGAVVVPRGTPVLGRIDAAHRRGHFKGRSILELRLVSMQLNGTSYDIDTHDTIRTKKGKGKRTAGFIGGLTGAGMLIGGIASGGAGLAIGAASGAGAGTLLAGTTGNRDIVIPAESVVRFRLADVLVVQTP
jgi:hypothetical protein